ncbi:MAG: GGDEF domain-containing protein [Lachnospiraceae bacterium]|nr:GGDEF domain-containing protein [Lachnospiraceae bacterium]
MDFQAIVDGIAAMTCVVSVERLENGRRGKFRIVAGNRAYIDSIEKPQPGMKMLSDKFIPNTEYTDYLTRDMNFEDFCYRAAVEKKCLHSYAHPDRMPVWFNMTFLPLGPDEGNLSYCTYTMEINFEAVTENMTGISGDMASKVLQTTIKLRGTSDFIKSMGEVIKDIGEMCQAEHCCILQMDSYDRSCSVLGEYLSPGTKLLPMKHYVDDSFYDIAESWEATIAGSNCLIVKDEQDMEIVKERNPVWHNSLTSAGGKTIVLFPLKSRDTLLGYMWAINFNSERAVEIKETLELTTFILGSELGNYLLLDRLKILSSRDMLTGVMNRNEMNNLVDSMSKGDIGEIQSVGVIFADLNGLKTVNDSDGHAAGDKLLKDAAAALRDVFDEECIFRAGGDEFSIIILGLTEEKMNLDIDNLRKVSEKYDRLSFAVGGAIQKSGRDVRTALRMADERMYEDKKKYYEKYPERKRVNTKDDFIIK